MVIEAKISNKPTIKETNSDVEMVAF